MRYLYSENGTQKATVISLTYSGEWMGDRTLSVNLQSDVPIQWAVGDYVMYRGVKYVVRADNPVLKQSKAYQAGDSFKYDEIKLDSYIGELKSITLLNCTYSNNTITGNLLTRFDLFCSTVQTLADIIKANLKRAKASGIITEDWTVECDASSSTAKTDVLLSFDGTNLWNACRMAYNDFNVTFVCDSDTRKISFGKEGTDWKHKYLGYGKGKGCTKIKKTPTTDGIVNVLRAMGNTTNLPLHYYYYKAFVCGLQVKGELRDASAYLGMGSTPYQTGKIMTFDIDDIVAFQKYIEHLKRNESYDRYVKIGTTKIKCATYSAKFKLIGSASNGAPNIDYSKDVSDKLYVDTERNLAYWFITDEVVEDILYIPSQYPKYYKYNYILATFNEGVSRAHLLTSSLKVVPEYGYEVWSNISMNQSGRYQGLFDMLSVQNLQLPNFGVKNTNIFLENVNSKIKFGAREGVQIFDTDSEDGVEDIYPTISKMTMLQLYDAGYSVHINSKDSAKKLNNIKLDEVLTSSYMKDVLDKTIELDDGIFGINDMEEYQGYFYIHLRNIGFGDDRETICGKILTEGTNATISMKSGSCAGYDFKVIDWQVSTDKTEYILKCERTEDSSRNVYMPNKHESIKEGDRFVLTDILMTETYIDAASARLAEVGTKYLNSIANEVYQYEPTIDSKWLLDDFKQNDTSSMYWKIKEGDRFYLYDYNLGIYEGIADENDDETIEPVGIIIDKITITEQADKSPRVSVTLRDVKTESALAALEKRINNNIALTANSIYKASQIDSVMYADEAGHAATADLATLALEAKDLTKEKQQALEREFLRKDKDDTTNHKITAEAIDVNYLNVKKKWTAEVLEVAHIEHVAGNMIVSPAHCTLSKVTYSINDDGSTNPNPLCWFKGKDDEGNVIANPWKNGDFAYCCTLNLKQFSPDGGTTTKASNHYFWGRIIQTGIDIETGDYFFRLSSTDMDEGSDTPIAGDYVVARGSTRAGRQGTIELNSMGDDAPSIKVYDGIKSYTMPSPIFSGTPTEFKVVADKFKFTTGTETHSITQLTDDYCVSKAERKRFLELYESMEEKLYYIEENIYTEDFMNDTFISEAVVRFNEIYQTLHEEMLVDIINNTPCYFSDAPNVPTGEYTLEFTRQKFCNAVAEYEAASDQLNDAKISHVANNIGSAAAQSAKQYVQNHINEILDASTKSMVEGWIDAKTEGKFATSSSLVLTNNSIQAITNWVGKDANTFGGTGLATHLSSLFVGTNSITMVEKTDSNGNTLYWQDANHSSEGLSDKGFGSPMVVSNISKDGLVTDTNFASLVSRVEGVDGTVEALASMATFSTKAYSNIIDDKHTWHKSVSAEDKAQGKYYYWTSNATIAADKIILGSDKNLGEYVQIEGGNMTLNKIEANNGVFNESCTFKGQLSAASGTFAGFVKRKPIEITSANLSNYTSSTVNYNGYAFKTINLSKTGSLIYFKDLTQNIQLSLGGTRAYSRLGVTQDDIDEARSLLGITVMIYNYSNYSVIFDGSILNSNKTGWRDSRFYIAPNNMIMFTCIAVCFEAISDDTGTSYVEDIGWEITGFMRLKTGI